MNDCLHIRREPKRFALCGDRSFMYVVRNTDGELVYSESVFCPICLGMHKGKLKSEVQDGIFGDKDESF